MPSERAFRVLREQSDRVSLRQLASIALACVGLGLGLSTAAERFMHALPTHGGREPDRAGQRSQHEAALAAAARGPALASASVAWPFLVGEPQPRRPAARTALADTREQAGAHAHRGLRFARERVTYLSCQHTQRARGGAACGRAPALEKQVWQALRGLGACYDATAPGHAELQLRIRRDHAPEIAFFAPAEGPSLNLRAVRGCVDPSLRTLSERIVDAPMLVSFRFGLR